MFIVSKMVLELGSGQKISFVIMPDFSEVFALNSSYASETSALSPRICSEMMLTFSLRSFAFGENIGFAAQFE